MSRRAHRRHHKARLLSKHRSRTSRTCWPAEIQEKIARRRVQHHSRHVWKEDRSWQSEKNRLKVQDRALVQDLEAWQQFEDPEPMIEESPMDQLFADLLSQLELSKLAYVCEEQYAEDSLGDDYPEGYDYDYDYDYDDYDDYYDYPYDYGYAY